MKLRILAAVAAALMSATCSASAAPAPAAAPAATHVKTRTIGDYTVANVAYYSTDPDQNADVWFDPAALGGPTRPAVVIVHGGSWGNGSAWSETTAAQKFADAGFVVMNINYRLTQTVDANLGTPWPAQRIDVALAINWLKANAATYGTAANRIGLYGFSAGGHLAVLSSGYYNSVRAVVSVSGVLEPGRVALVAENADTGYDGDPWLPSVAKLAQWESVAMTCAYYPTWTNGSGGCGDRWRTFEPGNYLAANKPPQYLVMGDADPAVPLGTFASWDEKAWAAGVDNTMVLVPNRGHDESMLTGTGADDAARWADMISWLRAHTL